MLAHAFDFANMSVSRPENPFQISKTSKINLTIPLTDAALSIIEQTHSLYPDTEYLFMRDREQILANTFNEMLMKVCKEMNIKYRSSHQLRFTVATLLFENSIPITQLSTLLGHVDTAMTWHYIRKEEPDTQKADIMKAVLR